MLGTLRETYSESTMVFKQPDVFLKRINYFPRFIVVVVTPEVTTVHHLKPEKKFSPEAKTTQACGE